MKLCCSPSCQWARLGRSWVCEKHSDDTKLQTPASPPSPEPRRSAPARCTPPPWRPLTARRPAACRSPRTRTDSANSRTPDTWACPSERARPRRTAARARTSAATCRRSAGTARARRPSYRPDSAHVCRVSGIENSQGRSQRRRRAQTHHEGVLRQTPPVSARWARRPHRYTAEGQHHREKRHAEVGGEPLPRALRQGERRQHGKRGSQNPGITGHPPPAPRPRNPHRLDRRAHRRSPRTLSW